MSAENFESTQFLNEIEIGLGAWSWGDSRGEYRHTDNPCR